MSLDNLYQQLLRPTDELVSEMANLRGDILVLGVGGKMGPALATLAKEAVDFAGIQKKVIGVSRFSESGLQEELEKRGIETHKADLLQEDELQSLPYAPNVLYLAGTKFGTTGNEPRTWAMNAYLPGRIAEKYKGSRVVVFSTGNVYPFVPIHSGGATEDLLPEPLGEYAQSCLGRERIFQYFSEKFDMPILIYRLNYANDVTYGVLLEIGKLVQEGRPIDLRMGYVNVIWQGDANDIALRALKHCSVPARILNVTGTETISVRSIAYEFARIFKIEPLFLHEEQSTALLSNAAQAHVIFGQPRTRLEQMIGLIAAWINSGGRTLNKPTHFQERGGRY
jgi:nucleoside-diphosphate-sugar epimerase